VAAAVVLAKPIEGLRDSKKLSKSRRENLVKSIEMNAHAIGIGWVWPEYIDDSGLTNAVRQAMIEALQMITCAYDEVIVDGSINYCQENPKSRALVRADDLIPAVSAASIIAKVARDKYMAEAALNYPGYGFERHVGYGTAQHFEQLKLRGVTAIHRQSYKPIRALLQLPV
jgi:ribonuclease HII